MSEFSVMPWQKVFFSPRRIDELLNKCVAGLFPWAAGSSVKLTICMDQISTLRIFGSVTPPRKSSCRGCATRTIFVSKDKGSSRDNMVHNLPSAVDCCSVIQTVSAWVRSQSVFGKARRWPLSSPITNHFIFSYHISLTSILLISKFTSSALNLCPGGIEFKSCLTYRIFLT
jgi:hypothetical protein